MIERERRAIEIIHPSKIFLRVFFTRYELLFFLSFWSLFRQLPGVRNYFIQYHINTHTHLHEYKMFSLTTSTVASAKITSKVRECVIIFVSFGSRGYPRRRFQTRIARFRTIPIVSFLSQDGKKDDFCADDEKSILMRALICDVANGNATSQSRA